MISDALNHFRKLNPPCMYDLMGFFSLKNMRKNCTCKNFFYNNKPLFPRYHFEKNIRSKKKLQIDFDYM